LYFKVLFFNYLKNFLFIFLSLVLFFVFIDFMLNVKKLPNSTNLEMLYIFFESGQAAFLIYPVSLVFGVIVTLLTMIKKNEMIAFLSLGYSPKKLMLPILSLGFIIFSLFFSLQLYMNTSFKDKAQSVLNGKIYVNITRNMFFKFKDKVIFIKKLNLIKRIAYDMRIYELENGKVIKSGYIKKAKFENNYWVTNKAVFQTIHKNKIITNIQTQIFLKGFKPDILNKLESKQSMSLKIALETLYLLKKENIDLNFLKTYIYSAIIPPLSFLLLSIILFLKSPIHSRISNVSLYVFISVFSVIILWGAFLIFKKMALNNILSADVVFLTPFSILLGLTIYYLRKI